MNTQSVTRESSTEDKNKWYRKHRTSLTRAKNTKDPHKILKSALATLADFDDKQMWPDEWRRWEIAKEDAQMAIARGQTSM